MAVPPHFSRRSSMRSAEVTATLRGAGCVFAEDEAQLLITQAGSEGELEHWVSRRVEGEPLEQIVGWAEFRTQHIVVEPGVFVPRRRTELLVELARERAQPGNVVVDLCCGSGAVAAAIAAECPGVHIYAADIDPAAVHCARRNLPPENVFESDLFANLPVSLVGRVDILTVNAPYVPTGSIGIMPPEARLYEHAVALDGGADGLDVQRRVAADAVFWLAPGGLLIIETSELQVLLTAQLVAEQGFHARIERSELLDATAVVGVLL